METIDVWARLGVTMSVTPDELNTLLGITDDQDQSVVVANVFREGRVRVDGDSYIPEPEVRRLIETDLHVDHPIEGGEYDLDVAGIEDEVITVKSVDQEIDCIHDFIWACNGTMDKFNKRVIRALWTAYCYNNDLEVDTLQYDNLLMGLYITVRDSGCTEWSSFDDFNNYICKYIV